MINKKAMSFATWMVLVALIAVPFLIIGVNSQLQGFGRVIGDNQVPILLADTERTAILNIIDKNAPSAFNTALIYFSEHAGFADAPFGYESGCAVLNTKEKPKELFLPDLSYGLNHFFTEYMNDLNKKSSNDVLSLQQNIPYELYIDKSKIKGIALKNINVDLGILMPEVDVIGEFSFKPGFSTSVNNELSFYPEILDHLQNIVKFCASDENPAKCADDLLPGENSDLTWVLESFADDSDLKLFRVYFKNFDRRTCYGLYLPLRP